MVARSRALPQRSLASAPAQALWISIAGSSSGPQRKTAVAKSKELADTMAPTFEKAKSAFINAYEEFTKDR